MKINTYLTKSKPEEWILVLLSFLQQDQNFEKLVLALREKLKISQQGLNEQNWIQDFNNRFLNWDSGENKKEKFKILSNGVKEILNSYLLPLWWTYPLQIFVVYNVLPVDDNLIELEPMGASAIKIRFREEVSQTEFIEWIKRHWQVFKWAFPESRKTWRPKIKLNMISMYERIIELKNKQGYHFSDIAGDLEKELQEKFGENYDSEAKINEESVKRMYHRYKDYLQKFKSTK